MYFKLNPDGSVEPTDMHTWAKTFCDPGSRQVALNQVGSVMVSTIFLGLNQEFDCAKQPILFETVVRWPEVNSEHIERFATREEALAFHAAYVAALEAGKSKREIVAINQRSLR